VRSSLSWDYTYTKTNCTYAWSYASQIILWPLEGHWSDSKLCSVFERDKEMGVWLTTTISQSFKENHVCICVFVFMNTLLDGPLHSWHQQNSSNLLFQGCSVYFIIAIIFCCFVTPLLLLFFFLLLLVFVLFLFCCCCFWVVSIGYLFVMFLRLLSSCYHPRACSCHNWSS
jgi:hypothetical protein